MAEKIDYCDCGTWSGSHCRPRHCARTSKFLPCPICGGVEGCDHSVPERAYAWQIREEKMQDAAERGGF